MAHFFLESRDWGKNNLIGSTQKKINDFDI
jgi:hypothetical protein